MTRLRRETRAERGSVLLAVVVLLALLIPVVAQVVFRSASEGVRCANLARAARHQAAARSALAEVLCQLREDPWMLQASATDRMGATIEFEINGCRAWCLLEDESAKVNLIEVYRRRGREGLKSAVTALCPPDAVGEVVPDLSLWTTEELAFDGVGGLECLVAARPSDEGRLYPSPERVESVSRYLTVWGDGSININTVSREAVEWLLEGASAKAKSEWAAVLAGRPYESALDFVRRSRLSYGAQRAFPVPITFEPGLVCVHILTIEGTHRARTLALLENRKGIYACVLWREMGFAS